MIVPGECALDYESNLDGPQGLSSATDAVQSSTLAFSVA